MEEEPPRENKYGRRIVPTLPWLPEVRPEWETEAGYCFRRIDRFEHPPLFVKQSWTKGVPSKDTQMYFKPTETIGASYAPQVQDLRIQDMPPRKKKPRPGPFDPDGKLKYPPKKTRKEIEEEERKEKAKNKKKKSIDSAYVEIEDLLNGEYWRRRNERQLKRQQERKMKTKVDLMQWEGFPDETE